MRLDVVVINRQSDRAHFLGMYACLSASSGGPFSSGMLCCLMRIQYNIIIYIILVYVVL